jgi:hypothetical protein
VGRTHGGRGRKVTVITVPDERFVSSLLSSPKYHTYYVTMYVGAQSRTRARKREKSRSCTLLHCTTPCHGVACAPCIQLLIMRAWSAVIIHSSLKCPYFSYNIALHLAPPITAHIAISHFRLASPGVLM